MARAPFSIVKAIKFAFTETLEHLGLWLAVWFTQLAVWVSLLVSSFVMLFGLNAWHLIFNQASIQQTAQEVKIVFLQWPSLVVLPVLVYVVFASFVVFWLHLGVVRMVLDIYDYGTAKYRKLFTIEGLVVLRYIGALVLISFLATIGLLLLIVPGVLVILFFCFTGFIIVDKHLGIIDALSLSYRLSAQALGKVFALFLIIMSIHMVVSVLPLSVFLTPLFFPLTGLLFVYAYRHLLDLKT
jgi:uncharacterized membrane protein